MCLLATRQTLLSRPPPACLLVHPKITRRITTTTQTQSLYLNSQELMMKDEESSLQEPLTSTTTTTTNGTGTSSSFQTMGNIIVSIVGTGILGLPYAFKVAGWLTATIGVIFIGLITYYCMILLVQCKEKQEDIKTYGDLGLKALGRKGGYFTEFLIVISQCGGSVAYLVFIGQNLSSVLQTYNLRVSSIILALVPIEVALSWIRSLSAFSYFSGFASLCNVLAMAMVVKADLEVFDGFRRVKAVKSIGGLPFAVGVAVFCFEGFGMTLPLHGSMKERRRFGWVLGHAFLGIIIVYVCFGMFGYLAYGEQTKDIITLNLPSDFSSAAVKIGLCVALTFAFPIMMHPIHEIAEAKLNEREWFRKLCSGTEAEKYVLYASRSLIAVTLALIALCVPGFGVFASMVGSTVCALLSFVLPATFHLIFMGSSLGLLRKSLDVSILVFGLAFAAYGTYNTVFGTSAGTS